MVAPVLGLPALLKAIATIGVGGAVGYKAQKDLQPLIKKLKASPKDMDSSELKMLRALFMPTQAVASGLKKNISEFGLKVPGVLAPDADEMEKVRQDVEKNLKPGETKKIDIPLTTGGSEPPKIDTTETFPLPEEKLPVTTGGSEIPEQLPTIFEQRGIGDNNPPEAIEEPKEEEKEKTLTTQNFLDDKLMNDLLVMRGGIEGFKKKMSGPMAPMPASTKAKMEMELQNKLFEKYRIHEYPEGETPENTSKERQQELINTYNKRLGAIEYITSVAYDTIGTKEKDSLLVVDEDGLPIAGAKIALPGSGRVNQSDVNSKDALVIVEAGSVFRDAGDQLFNDIIQKARDEGRRFVVAEDLTSPEALEAMKKRGFKPTTTKELKKFKGKKIRRPNGRVAVQKNLVLDLGKIDQQIKAPAVAGTKTTEQTRFYPKAQEGGKEITAGISAQREDIPELLEQGKLAVPIKNFFESTPDVVNYKIADTVGSYAETVERSLDIEANVKSNFNLDKFGDVIKERAKEFNQDAAFVAETVPSDFEGANIGFEMDFGSDLKMQDAINFANLVNETATVDGFTFKVKNLDSSGSSIYLPQTEKDLELIQKSIKKFGTTEDIRDAGFIMPDGKMLNFNMRGGNFRDTEHRRVGFLTTEGYNGVDFGPMYDWMLKTGGVRVTGNQNRLYAEFAGKPTTTQIKKLTDEYNQNRDKYDSMIVSITMPGDEDFFRGGFGTEQYRGGTKGIDLRKQKLRLPNEAFYEVNGEEANANDIYRKFKATDIVGKTFTGLRQINLPEFSNLSNVDARKRINAIYQNIEGLSENSGLKKLDKPKIKFYNTKLYTKGKDY